MKNHVVTGVQVDNDALSEALHRIADGIDEGHVAVSEASTHHDAAVDSPSVFGLSLEYHIDEEFVDSVDVIDYEVHQ